MYVIRRHFDTNQNFIREYVMEMTAKEFKAAPKSDTVNYIHITAERARDLVRAGETHETGLYIDFDGKMRYAKADPNGY